MGEKLKAIVMTISGIIIFGSICEMMIPDGGYRKIIHLTVGIMLITAIISPFLELDASFIPDIPSENAFSDFEAIKPDADKETITLYKKKLSESILADIKDCAGVKVSLSCDVFEDGERFGKIKAVNIAAYAENGEKINDAAIKIIKEKYAADNVIIKYLR